MRVPGSVYHIQPCTHEFKTTESEPTITESGKKRRVWLKVGKVKLLYRWRFADDICTLFFYLSENLLEFNTITLQ